MGRKSGLPCGNTDTLMLTASLPRFAALCCNVLVFFQYKMFASGEAKVDPSEGYFKEDK